jgi:hypothetical protein
MLITCFVHKKASVDACRWSVGIVDFRCMDAIV